MILRQTRQLCDLAGKHKKKITGHFSTSLTDCTKCKIIVQPIG